MKTKNCKRCKKDIDIKEFWKNSKAADGLYAYCKPCGRRVHIDYSNRVGLRSIERERIRQRKQRVIKAYGGKCVCCGESLLEFLTIDHINGYVVGPRKGSNLYGWLEDNGYPKEGFQLMCYNCNCSKGRYGYCPHHPELIYPIVPALGRPRTGPVADE